MARRISRNVGVSSRINIKYAEKLEYIAIDTGASLAEIIRAAIYEYVDRNESEQHNKE